MPEEKKKTPSPKVLASQWLLNQLDTDKNENQWGLDSLASLFDSRVSDDKRAKVLEQIGKITGKFKERLQKTMAKYHGTDTASTVKKKKK